MWKCLFVAIFTLSSLVFAEDKLSFHTKASSVAELTLDELQKIAKPVAVKVFEYQDKSETTYLAIPLQEVLDHIYGKKVWRSFQDIQFHCINGYKPLVPISEFVKHEAYLAFAREDKQPFKINSSIHQNESVKLGPFYLIWNNLKDRNLKAQGPDYWPYQLTGLDLVNFSDVNPRMAPPKNASSQVQEGFTLFRKSCLPCHKINGVGGGSVASELNKPVSITKYFNKAYLAKWIENSTSIRSTSTMPNYGSAGGFELSADVRKKNIDKMILYLEAMAKK